MIFHKRISLNMFFLSKKLFLNYIFSFISVVSGVLGLSILTKMNGIEYVGIVSIYLTSVAIYLAFESGSYQYLVAYFVGNENKQSFSRSSILKEMKAQFFSVFLTLVLMGGLIKDMNVTKYESAFIAIFVFISLVSISLSLLSRVQLSARKLVNINSRITALSLMSRYIGLCLISMISENIAIHFLYLTVVTVFESSMRMYSAYNLLYRRDLKDFLPSVPIKSKFSVGIGALSLAGDRWCIGFLYSEKELGIYTLAVNASSALMNLVTPLITFMMPYLIEGGKESRRIFYKNLFLIYFFASSFLFLFLLFFFDRLDEYIAPSFSESVSLMLIIYFGGVLNSLAEPIYANWLKLNDYRSVFFRNFLSIVFLFFVTIFLYFTDVISMELVSMLHVFNGLNIYILWVMKGRVRFLK